MSSVSTSLSRHRQFVLAFLCGIENTHCRWPAVFAGFIGVLLIAQPGGADWDIGVYSNSLGVLISLVRVSQVDSTISVRC